MPGKDVIFYGTTGPTGVSDGDSQPDHTKWLGRYRASQTLHSFQSTLTSAQTSEGRHMVVDSARSGDGEDAHALKWLLMLTGTNAMAAARVMAFDDATGAYKLDRALGPGNAGIGDYYAIYETQNVYEDVTAEQAQEGDVRYRCIACRNAHPATLTDVKFYFRDLGSLAGSEFHRFNQRAASANFLQRSDDVTDLFNALGERDPMGGPDGFGNCGPWMNPFGYGTADTLSPTFGQNTNLAIWLRRTIPAGLRFRRSVAIQIVMESTLAGSDPDPLTSGTIVAFDVLGGSLEIDLEADRYVHVGGGARMWASLLGDGVPIRDRPGRFDIRPGDLGSIYTDDDPIAEYDVTDEDGEAGATFVSPTAESAAGEVSIVQFIVGDGEEVGDPRPRVNLDVSTTFGFDATATLTVPAGSRAYLGDPGSGWWPSH